MSLVHTFQTYPSFFIFFCTIFGLLIGSFLNVIILRLPKMMESEWQKQCAAIKGDEAPDGSIFNLIVPRSHCPSCQHQIKASENVPVLSYLMLRGRCSVCHNRISIRYPLIEGLTAVLSGFTAWHFGFGTAAIGALFFVWCMIALSFIDFDTQLLPDDITLPLLWIGLLFNSFNIFTDLRSAVIGAVVGYLSLWTIYWVFKLVTGKEGMGYGDFKLLAAIGAWFGWQALILVILLSSFVGAIVGISLIIFAKHSRHKPIPFGPYLACAGIIALFWGKSLTHAYLQLF